MKEYEKVDSNIEKHILILAPIMLDNEEIKERDGEDLLVQEDSFSLFN